MALKSVLKEEISRKSEDYGFDRKDAKGRKTGLNVVRSTVVLVAPTADGPRYGYGLEPGTYFTLRMQVTKDGSKWGASQATKYFTDEAKRDEKAAARIADEITKK